MKAPKAPDPYATAGAQQRAEVGAGGASSVMNNPNIVTPYGSQSYSISGWEQVPGADGKMINVPRYTQTQTLSPDQKKLMGLNTQASYNLGQTAVQQSAKMQKYLGQGVNTNNWQKWNAGPNAPKLATSFADVGGPQRQIAGGGNIQKSIGNQNVRQDTGPTDRASIERAMMQNYTQDTQGQNAAQDAQMAARGLAPGSSQYGSMDQTRQQARGRAVNDAYLASGAESREAQNAYNQAAAQRFSQGKDIGSFANQAQLQQFQQNAAQGQFANSAQAQAYQQAMQRAGFSNEALGQMYQMQGSTADRANALRGMQGQEAFALRNQPINEISALMGGAQVTMPQFSPYQGQGVNSANIAGMIGQNYQQQNAAAQNFNQGLFSLGGAGLGAIGTAWGSSDRRLKHDITPLGTFLAGAPLYEFRFNDDPEHIIMGVMSDEVRERHPDAVREVDGYDQVNYGLLVARHNGEQP